MTSYSSSSNEIQFGKFGEEYEWKFTIVIIQEYNLKTLVQLENFLIEVTAYG